MALRGPGAIGLKARKQLAGQPRRRPPWKRSGLDRAGRVIAFIQSLKMSRDQWAGKPFRLRGWQKDVVRKLCAEGPDRKRLVREALLTIGRKNGKSEFSSGLALCWLCGPEAVPRGECYAAAQDKVLAGRIFENLEAFIKADPELTRRTNIKRFEKSIEVLSGEGAGSYYKTLSADESKGHGLNPHFVVMDELAQWKSRLLYDNIMTGFGAREEPLAIVISTKSKDPHSVMAEVTRRARQVLEGVLDDPTFAAIVYEVPDDCPDIWDERVWKFANPALSDFRSLDEMRNYARKAKRTPSLETSFRRLYLNQTVDDSERAIPIPEWNACQGAVDLAALRGKACWGGLDLSSTTDLTAFVLWFPESGVVLAWFWLPAEGLQERSDREDVPFVLWRDQGFLRTTAGRAINRRAIAMVLEEVCSTYDVKGIAYDRFRIEDLLVLCHDEGLDELTAKLQPFGQGYTSMAPAFDATETAVLDRKLVHDGNPILRWNVANAVLVSDPAGNRKLDKAKSAQRIDGLVAVVMAIGLYAKAPPEDHDRPFSGTPVDGIFSRGIEARTTTRRKGHAADAA